MNLNVNVITRAVSRQVLKVQKHSPQLLFAAGVAGFIGTTVLACKATLKLGDELDHMRELIDDHNDTATSLSKEPNKKDIVYIYATGTYEITKLYAPAIVLGSLSIAALTSSHVILTKRNTALTAAYAGLSKAFDDYRERVRKELGDEKERDLRHGAVIEKMNIGGKVENVKVVDPNGLSIYAKFFDEYNRNWQKDSESNRLFLQCQQNYANNMLIARGHVFLNEVYDMLGMDHTTAGAVVGWVVSQSGDNFIDFGIFDAANSRFVNGMERSIILDFNVDGVIYDKI